MTTLRTTVNCIIRRNKGLFDKYGRSDVSTVEIRAKCAVIFATIGSDKSSVRADSSASRGRADEVTNEARLLFRPNVDIRIGDVVVVLETSLKIETRRLMPSVDGKIHHIMVEGNRWV